MTKKRNPLIKHPYVSLLFVLSLLVLWFFSYSYSNFEFKAGFIVLKKSDMASFLDKDANLQEDEVDSTDTQISLKTVNTVPSTVIKPKEPDTTSQRILLIGDSMLEGLRCRLFDYCIENNHNMKAVIWYSSSTLWYGNSDTLTHFIQKYQPTYLLISLGTNEQFVKDIDRREKCIKNILKQVGDLPYVWIGPPSWKKDTGINQLIKSQVGDCRYFDSSTLTLSRAKDGAHPTKQAAAQWMDSLAVFLHHKACHPISLKRPEVVQKSFPNTILLQPNPPPSLK